MRSLPLLQCVTLCLFFFLSNSVFLWSQDSQTVSFTVTNGAEERCAADSLVNISIKPNPSLTLTSITLSWGDQSPVVTILPGEPLDRSHTFPGESFLEECNYSSECVALGLLGFCFDVKVIARYSNESTENVSKTLTFQTPPRPNFNYSPSIVCVDETISFSNNTCPGNDPNMVYKWKLPNGQTSDQFEINEVFSNSGSFPIELVATNKCGADSITKNLTIQDLPLAVSAIDSGSVSFSNNLYRVCLGAGGIVRLNADSSLFANSYRWSISSSSGIEWVEGRNQKITRLDFNQPGSYTITLEVDNGCNEPSQTSFDVEVLDSSSLSLQPQPNECLSLSYQPNPINPNAIYRIDGQEVSVADFPIMLTDRQEPYVVTALLPNVCGDITLMDTFRVFSPTTPTLVNPTQDTSVCAAGGRLLLQASPGGGSWQANERIVQEGNQFYFDLDGPAGVFMLTYTFGSGACEKSASVTITTQQVMVNIGPTLEAFCVDNGTISLTATPATGQWDGDGVDTAGVFNPDVAGVGEHVLSYTVTDTSTGCTVKTEKTVVVNPLPSLELADSVTTCQVDAELELLSLTNAIPQPPDGTFQWTGIGVTNASTGSYNPATFGSIGVDTVRVVYTSPQQCRTSGISLIRIDDLVMATTIPDSTLCLGGTATLTLPGSPGGGSWEGDWINEDNGTIDLGQAQPGTFSYQYMVNKGTACESSANTNLTFVPGGSVNAGPDQYVCESENTIALQAAMPNDGVWSGPTLNGGNQINVQDLGRGAFEFMYTLPDLPAACNTDVMRVIIDSLPTAMFSADSIACVDAPVEVMAETSHADRWQWDMGNGQSGTGPTFSTSYSTTGDFTIALIASTIHPVNGTDVCRNLFTKNIFITEPPPVVDFTVSETEGCGPLSLSVDNISQGDFLDYNWELGNGLVSTEANPGMLTFFPGREDTVYTIRLFVSNGCGDQERSAEITVFPLPQADFGVDFSQPCSGDTLLINNTSTGNPELNHWTITSAGGLSAEFSSFNPPLLRPQTDTLPRDLAVRLRTSNSCGMDSITKIVTVFPTDVRALINIADKTVCVQDTVVLTSFSTPGSNLTWQLNGNTFDQPQIKPVFSTPGTYLATLFAERCGYDSTMVEFTVLPLPELDVSGDFLACEDAPASFSVVSNVAGHALYFGTGDSSLLNQVEYSFDTAGVYALSAVAVSPEGCQSSWNGSVQVESKPQVAFSFMDSLCARTPVRFVNDGPPLSCQWRFDGQDPQDDCDPEYVFSQAGLHSVQLTLSSATGCRDSLTQSVFVRPTPTADFVIQTIQDCSPALFRFEDQSVDATGLAWDFGDGSTSTAQNPEHSFLQAGSYPIRLRASYDGICFHDITKTVEVFPTPQIVTVLEEQCTETEGTDLVINTDIQSFILLNNEIYSEVGDFHPGLRPGTYQIRAESADGCVATEEVVVLPIRELQISLPVDSFAINLGESVRLEVLANTTTAVYDWTPPENLDDPATANPLARPFRTTDFVVTVTDDKGCFKLDTIHIVVAVEREEGIYLPNAFTPDGSGYNDVFRLRVNNPSVLRVKEFRVFDRWGELVFSAEDCTPNDGLCVWDGSFRGQPAAIDVYVYYVEIEFVDGETKIMKGEINLIR